MFELPFWEIIELMCRCFSFPVVPTEERLVELVDVCQSPH